MHYIFPDLIAAGVEGVAVVPVYFLWQRFSNLSTSVSWLQLPAVMWRGCSCIVMPAAGKRGTSRVAPASVLPAGLLTLGAVFSDAFSVQGDGAGLFC